jgi:hypothetical protein
MKLKSDAYGEAPESGLADDVSATTRFVGVGGEGLVFGAAPYLLASARSRPNGRSPALRAVVGFDMAIALDRETELVAHRGEFEQTYVAQLLAPILRRSPCGPACGGSKRLLPF